MTIQMQEVKMLKAINATEAKKTLLQLLDKCNETPFLITKNGKPIAVLLGVEEYERVMETIKFYTIPEMKKNLEKWLEEK